MASVALPGNVLRSPFRAPALVISLITLVATMSGCSATRSADTLTAPVQLDAGFEVTVPALWADPSLGTGGIEPAIVRVRQSAETRFSIDLADIQAQGAGKAWTAASTSAAALGTMISGKSPEGLDISFSITGPIDGPSAGAILTVGVVAAILDAPLRDDVTMTGTISPDGSIGSIGGADLKLRAAAEAGFRTVLLPSANMEFTDRESGEQVSAIEYGQRLGLNVRAIASVQEAFAIFTDNHFAYPSKPAYKLSPQVAAATVATTEGLVAQLARAAIDLDPTRPAQGEVMSALDDARVSLAQGKTDTAYALAVDGMLVAARDLAEAAALSVIARAGVESAQVAVLAGLVRTRDEASRAIASVLDEASSMGSDQQLSVPSAMGWLVYSRSILDALEPVLTTSSDPAFIVRVARAVADQQVSVRTLAVDAMNVIRAMPTLPVAAVFERAAFLAAYADFLLRAGRANESYIRDVFFKGADPGSEQAGSDMGFMLPLVAQMSVESSRIGSEQETLRTEIEQTAVAMSYFIASSSLVSTIQVFGMYEFGVGADPRSLEQAEALAQSVRTGQRVVIEVTSILGSRGVAPGYSTWSAQWGAAAFDALSARGRPAAGGVLGLNEIWFDAVTVFMMQAAAE
jgi:hypothetical protein